MQSGVREVEMTSDSSGTNTRQSGSLKAGKLGVGALVFFVVSATAPLTTLTGYFPLGVMYGNGAGFPATFVLTTALLLLFSVGYTRIIRYVANAGAFYALVTRGAGGRTGGATALTMLLSYNCGQVAMQGLFGVAAADFMRTYFGVAAPWWVYCAGSIAVIGFLGYRKVDLSIAVLGLLVAAETLMVLAIDIGVVKALPNPAITLLQPFRPTYFAAGSISLALMMSLGSFVGFEATALYSEEARDPARTVPRATYLSVALIGVFYCVSGLCLVAAIGADKIVPVLTGMTDPTQLMYTVAQHFVSPKARAAVQFLLVTSTFASMLAFHNAAARYFFVLGREGILHRSLGRVHGKFDSPCAGSIAQTIIAAVVVGYFALAGLDPMAIMFAWLSSIGLLGVLAMMALVSFAVFLFFKANPNVETGKFFATKFAPVVSALLFALLSIGIALNMNLFAGATGLAGVALPALIVIFFVIGWARATHMRRKDPQAYSQLGANRY
jgi:amino acid transporter